MARKPIRGKTMEHRLTISMPADMDKRLKKFAKKSRMSAATAGRMAIDFLIGVSDAGVMPTGDQGTINYMLQQARKDGRGKEDQGQRRNQS